MIGNNYQTENKIQISFLLIIYQYKKVDIIDMFLLSVISYFLKVFFRQEL